MAKIYTRTGDDGTTGLGTGERVPKASLRIASYGTVDELNSTLGVARAEGLCDEVEAVLAQVQNDLFHLGCELAMPTAEGEEPAGPHIRDEHISALERAIDALTETLPPLTQFILPGGARSAAHLHVSRCVCRRAEREVSGLRAEEPVRAEAPRYLNRLSDYLFVAARYENHAAERPDVVWVSD